VINNDDHANLSNHSIRTRLEEEIAIAELELKKLEIEKQKAITLGAITENELARAKLEIEIAKGKVSAEIGIAKARATAEIEMAKEKACADVIIENHMKMLGRIKNNGALDLVKHGY